MGITSALSTGLSGLASNQAKLSVVGNNIANVNTVGFKSSRLDFKTEFSQTFSYGSAPDGTLGGTNPIQTGMGVVEGGVTRNFNDGSTEVTGVNSNMAIQGDGFFIVQGSTRAYTRDGTFQLNSENQLVSANGDHLQGYGVDANFNVVPGVLQNLTVPIGTLSMAQATTNIPLSGNLDANGALPTQVANVTLGQPLFVSNGAGGVTGTAPTATTPLSLLADASGALYFSSSDVLNLTGKVGTSTAPTKTLAVTPATGPASTLGDLESFINGTLGINTSAGANGSIATTPGASLAAGPAGAALLSINGNVGTDNNLALDPSSLTITNGASSTTPFTWNQNATADGASVATSMIAYDSLGNQVTTNVVASLVSQTNTGTTWQFYATSPDGSGTGAGTQSVVGAGTVSFDINGNYTGSTTPSVTIDRSNTGASPNLTFSLDFSKLTGQAASKASFLAASPSQDSGGGSSKGTLVSYSIDKSGNITGTFDNSLKRTLGQVALATFRNNQGLVDQGGNTYVEGPNSGTAIISAPGQASAGQIASGALEDSNVDLSSEFVQLISASTGFSASSRVITTSNQLLQDLLSSVR